MLDDGIYTMAYFHKDSVLQAVKIFKKILIIKKDCDKKGKIAQKKLHISNMMN